MALLSLFLLGLLVIASLAAPYIAPFDPEAVDLSNRAKPPFWADGADPNFILGTDMLGRDVLAWLLYGGRISLFVGFTSVAVAGLAGTMLGLLAGYYQGVVDNVIMRLVDIQLSFPVMLLAVSVLAVLGSGLTNIILVLGIVGWATYVRVVRAETMTLRAQEFVEAATATGVRPYRIILRHIVPNLVASVIVIASFSVGTNILAESALSFLGLGTEPTVPSWGRMLATGKEHLYRAPWLAIFPGLTLLLTVLSINIVGDWLRDYLDPRMNS
ncbi:MAG: ABC transporter permease [Caldilineaceae bacterium]|nr:ABC transporter permease [Caldilineaceae bacterium]